MKIISAILALAGLLILPAATQAKVLVYRGTLTFVASAPPQSVLPNVLNYFLLVDPDTQKTTNIGYFINKAGKKELLAVTEGISTYFISAPGKQGKTVTAFTFSSSATFTDAQDFSVLGITIYGTNSTIRFATTGSSQFTNYPLALKGDLQVLNSSSSSSAFSLSRATVTYQKAETIAINDAGTTIDDASKAISDQLAAKGYTAP
jgi:hypothetical protein